MTGSPPLPPEPGRPERRRLPARARLFQGEPVTEPLPLTHVLRQRPYSGFQARPEPDEIAERRRRLDLAVRVGELMLRCGAGTRDVEDSVVAVAASVGLRRLEVDITNQSLLVQCPSPSGGEPLTALRVVRSATRDFARLMAVHELADRVVAENLDLEQASTELKELQRTPRLYPRWLVSLGYAGLAASVSAILGAGALAVAVSLVSAVLIDRVGRVLTRRGLPNFYVCAAGGGISTVLTWAAYVLSHRLVPAEAMTTQDFAYAVAAGIVVQLPGRAMVSAVEDTVTGYPVTGAGRLLTVGLTAAGIIVGVAAGLSLTLRMDRLFEDQLVSPGALRLEADPPPLAVMLLAAALGALCSGLSMRTRPRMLLPTALLGALAMGLSQVAAQQLGLGATTAVAVAAVVAGVVGRMVGTRLVAPSVVLVVPAISPLMPGLRIFRGMYEAVAGSVVGITAVATQGQGVATLVGAAAVALALATGVVLGDFLAAPMDASRAARRRARRR